MRSIRKNYPLLVLINVVAFTFGEVANDVVKTNPNFLKLQSVVSDMQLQFQEHQIELNKTKEDLRETKVELAETKVELAETKMELAQTKTALERTNLQVKVKVVLRIDFVADSFVVTARGKLGVIHEIYR